MNITTRLVNETLFHHKKVEAIKTIRTISGLGLFDAKKASESLNPVLIRVLPELVGTEELRHHLFTLVNAGLEITGTNDIILEKLRTISIEALQLGNDELANEILQLILAEKLRGNTLNI